MTYTIRNYTLSPQTFVAAEVCGLARIARGPKGPPHAAQWHGIAVHRFLEYVHKRGREAALAYIAHKFRRLHAFCAALDITPIPPGEPEVQFLIDPAEGTAIMLSEHDNVAHEADWRQHITVKVDHVAHDHTAGVWVIDYKTGKNHDVGKRLAQMQLEALAAWLALDRPAHGARASIMQVSKESTSIVEDLRWSATEMAQTLRRVACAHATLVQERVTYTQTRKLPLPVVGDHCNTCDVYPVCPGHEIVLED